MKRIISIIALGVIFNYSCTKIEDNLYDSINENDYPENDLQLAIIPSPAYDPMESFIDGGGWWFAQELTTNEMVCPTRAGDWGDGGKWTVLHTHEWTNTTEAINEMWSTFNNGIVKSNKAIEQLSAYTTTSARVNIAKLRILRGYYYYLLIDNYGDVPYVIIFKNAPAKPEKTRKDTIFYRITKEISKELQYIPADQRSKYSVTRGTAYSLLAKLYLNAEVYTGTQQWVLAEKYCDSVMNMGYTLESNPLAPFITENENSSENIWTIPYDENRYKGFNLHMRTLHYNNNLTFDMSVGPWNGFAVTEEHYKTYSSNDKRKGYFLVGQQYDYAGNPINDAGAGNIPLVFNPHIPKLIMDASNTPAEIRMSGARVVKFEIKLGAKADLSNDFPIFRYADILLMKAEAQLRQPKAVSVANLNTIRTRAGLPDGWDATLVGPHALDSLLAERGREMFWEAQRRQDLIRFGKFTDVWWAKGDEQGGVANNPSVKTFPIPQSAIDINPNLAK